MVSDQGDFESLVIGTGPGFTVPSTLSAARTATATTSAAYSSARPTLPPSKARTGDTVAG
jgi:hypothetical protein